VALPGFPFPFISSGLEATGSRPRSRGRGSLAEEVLAISGLGSLPRRTESGLVTHGRRSLCGRPGVRRSISRRRASRRSRAPSGAVEARQGDGRMRGGLVRGTHCLSLAAMRSGFSPPAFYLRFPLGDARRAARGRGGGAEDDDEGDFPLGALSKVEDSPGNPAIFARHLFPMLMENTCVILPGHRLATSIFHVEGSRYKYPNVNLIGASYYITYSSNALILSCATIVFKELTRYAAVGNNRLLVRDLKTLSLQVQHLINVRSNSFYHSLS
jgi:hypothetical protein